MSPYHESLPRRLAREYVLHRLGGRRHGRGYGTGASQQAYWMSRRQPRGRFGRQRPRRNVQVRGCGCCLPIPLALVTGAGLALRVGLRARLG